MSNVTKNRPITVDTERFFQEYQSFLKAKVQLAPDAGFEPQTEPHDSLKPHQADSVHWAVRKGRAAIFAAFGLGKTRCQLQLMRWVHEHTGGKVLIICPLGVRQEFTRKDGPAMGMALQYCRTDAEVAAAQTPYIITNYERVRDGDIDPAQFAGVSLDEASCLRSYGTKTTQEFCRLFKAVAYRFVATATPSPNDYLELINYADFLGVMDRGQSMTRFFQRDSKEAGALKLYAHEEENFWLWVASWALFISKPSDLGYSDEGYDLPPMQVHWHMVPADYTLAWKEVDSKGQQKLLPDMGQGLKGAAKERNATMDARISKAIEIIQGDSPEKHWLVWHDLEAERRLIERHLPEAKTVFGSQPLEEREELILGFSAGEYRILATKPTIAGSGCNFQQHCADAIFCGPDYKFNDFIQAIHRIYRFLQPRQVNIHIIYAETQADVVTVLKKKWRKHEELVSRMAAIVKKYGLSHEALSMTLTRKLGCDRIVIEGKNFTAANNDCVVESALMADDSVDEIITSIPFSDHYEYSPCYDETTEVLTRRGWLSFGDLTLNDEIATVNPASLQLEWQFPSEVIWRPYKGRMLHFADRNSFDLMVTPDHKMFVDLRVGGYKGKFRKNDFQLIKAEELESNFVFRRWRMLATTLPGTGNYPEYIEIPEVQQRILPKSKKISKISSADFMKLAGWYLSEGCCDPSSAHRGRFAISQCSIVNPKNRKEIIELLEKMGLRVTSSNPRNVETWNISLAAFLASEFGTGSYEKKIPRWVKDLHPELLCILRDTMMKGDGNSNGMAYTSYSKQLQDDFQEICLLTGWRASIAEKFNTIRIGQKNIFPNIRNRPTTHEYDGMIGCATVPNHTLIVRRNGKAIVSGNCYNDFGHNMGDERFFAQMDFLIPNLYRILKPGRVACIHTKDRIMYGNMSGVGMYHVNEFSDKTVTAFKKHGFVYMGRITVDTDVVRENAQTYRLGWSENAKDSTKMGVGSEEYILLFRKWTPQTSEDGTANGPCPVTKDNSEYTRSRWQIHAAGIWKSSGDRLVDPDMLKGMTVSQIWHWWKQHATEHIYDYHEHVKFTESVEDVGNLPASMMLFAPHSKNPNIWTDILRIKTLNAEQSRKRQESHICLSRGSLILTKQGYKPIEDIEIGDLCLTHKGRWRPVVAKACTGINPVIQVKAQGVANLVLTPNHKLWTRLGKTQHPRKYAMQAQPEWIRSDETKGSYVNLKLPPVEAESSLDAQDWWIVGRWLADGHYHEPRQSLHISVGRHKYDALVCRLGDRAGSTHDTGTSLQIRINDAGKKLRDVILQCGKYAHGKHLPPEAYTLPPHLAKALLEGYLSGDGHYVESRDKWMATSVSRELLLGLAMLVQRSLGVVASVYAGRKPGTTTIEGRTVNTKQDWVMCFNASPDGDFSPFMAEDGAWKKVRSTDSAGEAETWSLQVAEDESYTAEGCIVKNCPLQLDLIERLIERYSNPGDLVFDPFGGIGSVPYQALKMGRKAYMSELNPEYFRFAVGYCEKAEEEQQVPTLFDLAQYVTTAA